MTGSKKNTPRRLSHLRILAICIGVVYVWFGLLKFFPNASPAEDLAKETINLLTFGLIPSSVSIILLAVWETLVGVFLLFNLFSRVTIIFALIHMAFTFSPLLLMPDQAFQSVPFQFTLLGQYIVKNLVIVAALLILYRSESE